MKKDYAKNKKNFRQPLTENLRVVFVSAVKKRINHINSERMKMSALIQRISSFYIANFVKINVMEL